MNKKVKRYFVEGPDWELIEDDIGELVEYEDYSTLLAERDELRGALESFPGFLCGTATADAWIERKRMTLQES